MATFIFSSDLGLAALAGYSLSVGAAVARLLHRIGVPVKLKWPNDIVVLNSEIYGVGKGGIAYRKLGGILVEVEEYCGYKCILVGLGLNLSAPPADVRAIGVGVSELTGEDLSVEQIIGPLANELQSAHNLFVSGGGFGAVREIWSSYSCFVPNVTKLKIDLGEGVGEISGVYQGIGSAGSLLISDDGVMREVLSGHILE
jgi:BirA family biotin operon repressor/biotin-[acetyl-CoA-carboxylase] ligase